MSLNNQNINRHNKDNHNIKKRNRAAVNVGSGIENGGNAVGVGRGDDGSLTSKRGIPPAKKRKMQPKISMNKNNNKNNKEKTTTNVNAFVRVWYCF